MMTTCSQEAALKCKAIEEEQKRLLESMADDVRESLAQLHLFHSESQVNSHYDELISDIMLATESSACRVNKLAAELCSSVTDFQAQQTQQHQEISRRRDSIQEVIEFRANPLSFGLERASLGLLRFEDETEIIRIDEKAAFTHINILPSVQARIFRDESLYCCAIYGKLTKFGRRYKSGKEPEAIFNHQLPIEFKPSTFIELANGHLAFGGKTGCVIILDTRERRETLHRLHTKRVCSLQACQDGRLASLSLDNTLKVFDPTNPDGQVSVINGHGTVDGHCDLGILSNGLLITCSNDTDEGKLRVWDPSTLGIKLVREKPACVYKTCALRVLNDDLVALASIDGSIKLVSLDDDVPGRLLRPPAENTFTNFICGLPNGHIVVPNGRTNPMLQVWDTKTCRLVQSVQTKYRFAIESCELNPQQTRLVTCHTYGPVYVWPLCYEKAF